MIFNPSTGGTLFVDTAINAKDIEGLTLVPAARDPKNQVLASLFD